jgi:hypothetical protein
VTTFVIDVSDVIAGNVLGGIVATYAAHLARIA